MTKRFIIAFVFLLLGLEIIAQPANDDPCNAITLNVSTSCNYASFTNLAATPTTGLTAPGCGGYSGGDVWFKFTMPDNGFNVYLDMRAAGITDGGMAVYSGASCSALTLVSCDDNSGTGDMPALIVDDGCNFSEAGNVFWVRVWENGNDNNGSFDICARGGTAPVPAGVAACGANIITGNTCCDAILMSDMFDGYCGNTGGYTANPSSIGAFSCAAIENNSWIAFTAAASTVTLEMTSSNCLGAMSGDGVQAAILATNDCVNFSMVSNCWNLGVEGTGTITGVGLTPGEVYYLMVDGWTGDSCDYTINVISGVELTNVSASDDYICVGDSPTLSVNTVGIGPFTYAWSPGGGNKADTTVSPIVSTDYTVTVTNAGNTSVYNISIIVDDPITTPPSITGTTNVCENSSGVSYNASTTGATSYNWTVTGGGTINGSNTDANVSVDWGTSGGTLCVEAINECGASPQGCLTIGTIPRPNISATNPPVACAPNPVNLTSIIVSNSGTGGGPISYHANQADAEAGTNFISPLVSTSGTYWIRMQTSPDCYDVTSVVVTIEEPMLTISTPPTTCSPNTINLDTDVIVSEQNGFPGTESYFADSTDAVNNINGLGSPVVSTGGNYWVRYETTNGCVTVGRIVVNISVTPDFADANPAPLCPGDFIDLDTLTMVDANNATIAARFYYPTFFLAQTNITTFAITNTVVTGAGTYWVTHVNPDGCTHVAQINITEHTPPDGSISGGGTVCPGDSSNMTFNLNGTGPFDVSYTDGSQNFNLTAISNGHIVRVPANGGTTYTFTTITDANGCTGTITGSPVIVNEHTAPIGGMTGGGTGCYNTTGDLVFNLIGAGPFSVEYTDGNQTFSLTNIANGHREAITLLNDSTFSMTTVTDANGCTAAGSGMVNFDVYQPLQVINLSETCNNAKTDYTVSFEIIGGDPGSYSVSGGGSLVGNVFTSNNIPSNTPYNFTISDGTSCPSVSASGVRECLCVTDAGTMSSTPLSICQGNSASASHNGDEVLDAGDLLLFALHDGSGNSLGTIFATNLSPIFNLQVGMSFGTTYYISPFAGPDDGAGNIDLNHACLSVGQGTPVIFHEAPVATLSGGGDICEGDMTSLTFNFTAGTGPFDVVYAINGANQNLNNINDGFQLDVSPTANTTYSIISVEDNTPATCSGAVSGVVSVNVNPPIQLANIVETCNGAKTGFRVSFDIIGGDPATYNVSGGGTLTGNSFVSDEIASGGSFNFIISDLGPCGDISLSGSKDCDCLTNAGTMNLDPLVVCVSETVSATHNNDQFLDPSTNDLLRFVLHDNPGAILGNVMATANTPDFNWQAGMTDGATYYISPIAGPDDGSGNIEQTHKCFRIAEGTPVQFISLPEASISGTNTICEGETADLLVNFTAGNAPFDIVISDGTTNDTIRGINSGYTYQATPTATTTYNLLTVWDNTPARCAGTVSGSADITVIELPEVMTPAFGCNNINTEFQVSFEITGGNPTNYTVAGGSGNLDNATNIFTSDFLPSGSTYYFEVTDGTGCPPVVVTGDYTCSCTTDAGQMLTDLIEVCADQPAVATWLINSETLDGNDVLGYVLHDSPGTTLGNVFMTNTIAEFSYDPALSYGTTYYISAVAGNDDGTGFPVLDPAQDVCLSVANGQAVIFYESPLASWSGGITICEGDTTALTYAISGDGPFDIRYTDGTDTFTVNGVDDASVLEVHPAVPTTYTLLSVQSTAGLACVGTIDPAGASVTINVIDVPEVRDFQVNCNLNGTAYTISFNLFGGNNTNYQINGDTSLALVGNNFESRVYVGGSTYYFEITDGSGCPPIIITDTEYCNCTPDIRPLASILSPISCGGGADGALSVMPINGQAPYFFEWSNGTVGTENTGLTTGWHYVSMTDANNCLTIDSIFLQEPTPVQASLSTEPISCFGDQNGVVFIDDAQGGAGNFSYFLDGDESSSGVFTDLPGGTYLASVVDENGCEWSDTITIVEPDVLTVDLGGDESIVLGDSVELFASANLSIDTFYWSPAEFIACDSCLRQFVKPEFTTIYQVRVVNDEGCEAEDQIVVNVNRDVPVYIPTAFTPNGDGFNDTFTIYGGDQVDRISVFRIFSRWGELVYEVSDMAPGDENMGWDGTVDLERMNGGVFIYYVEVVLADGTTKTLKGDVTLVK